MKDDRYYYLTQLKTIEGPVTVEELGKLKEEGAVDEQTPVCRKGSTDWGPLKSAGAGGGLLGAIGKLFGGKK